MLGVFMYTTKFPSALTVGRAGKRNWNLRINFTRELSLPVALASTAVDDRMHELLGGKHKTAWSRVNKGNLALRTAV